MSLLEHRRYRLAVLKKMAAPIDLTGGRKTERVKEREVGEAGGFLQPIGPELTHEEAAKKTEEEQAAVGTFLTELESLKPAEQIANEVPNTYKSFFIRKGLNPDKDPSTYTPSEMEKAREVHKEIENFITVGYVPGETSSERHIVDPDDSKNSIVNKYFGYFHKSTGEWFFTQNTLVMFYLAFYAKAVGLGKYQDQSRTFKMPKNHPYFKKYPAAKLQLNFIPLKPEIENRINANFNEIANLISRHSWGTLHHEDYFSMRPPEAGERLRNPYTFDFVPDPNDPSGGLFAIKTPSVEARVSARERSTRQSIITEQQKRLVKDLFLNPRQYPKIEGALDKITQEFANSFVSEVLRRRKEFNFLGSSPEARQMVAEIVANSLVQELERKLQEAVISKLDSAKESLG